MLLVGICFYQGFSLRLFFVLLAGLQVALIIRSKYAKHAYTTYFALFPSMKPLLDYEREKFGPEWEKNMRLQAKLNVILLIVFVLQALRPSDNLPFDARFLLFYIGLAVFMMILINVSHYFHVRKVDSGNSEALQGYTKKVLLLGIIGGLFVTGVIIVLIVLTIILMGG